MHFYIFSFMFFYFIYLRELYQKFDGKFHFPSNPSLRRAFPFISLCRAIPVEQKTNKYEPVLDLFSAPHISLFCLRRESVLIKNDRSVDRLENTQHDSPLSAGRQLAHNPRRPRARLRPVHLHRRGHHRTVHSDHQFRGIDQHPMWVYQLVRIYGAALFEKMTRGCKTVMA